MMRSFLSLRTAQVFCFPSPREAVGRVGERSEPGWGAGRTSKLPPPPTPPHRSASHRGGRGDATPCGGAVAGSPP
jgi:hypothetical protein